MKKIRTPEVVAQHCKKMLSSIKARGNGPYDLRCERASRSFLCSMEKLDASIG